MTQEQLQEQAVFLDRSALEAFMNPSHPFYRRAASFFYGLDDFKQPLVTINLMIYELHERIREQAGPEQAQFFINVMKRAEQVGVLRVIAVNESIEQEAARLMLEHHEDGLSFLEACTLVVMHDLGIQRLFSFSSQWNRISLDWSHLQIVPTS
ncbi:type II toxin-antitoxin system VapC family toxin [Ammoniphilus sp. YIM 78166]|uniref:type II toxin-antitoxin system VapC family toxin n=1 Tax=Ammoniphilus sp. YIM 78166 TaxID=1644106 RepID=UPI0010705D6B|nr:hypothetical protein [Ammoniphilus sp. YIM 78166]